MTTKGEREDLNRKNIKIFSILHAFHVFYFLFTVFHIHICITSKFHLNFLISLERVSHMIYRLRFEEHNLCVPKTLPRLSTQYQGPVSNTRVPFPGYSIQKATETQRLPFECVSFFDID